MPPPSPTTTLTLFYFIFAWLKSVVVLCELINQVGVNAPLRCSERTSPEIGRAVCCSAKKARTDRIAPPLGWHPRVRWAMHVLPPLARAFSFHYSYHPLLSRGPKSPLSP
jgi:hypothetical protein